MVASCRMNLGFLGWRMAHVMKKVRRTMTARMRNPAHIFRRSFLRLSLWWVHSLTDMTAVGGGGGSFQHYGSKVWTAICFLIERCAKFQGVGLVFMGVGCVVAACMVHVTMQHVICSF
ncbi:hypothetical protein HanRHA438_Chr15g0730381 [Helianthus annuus]|nr:hypothetical protein HanIR_Chr15g0781511 [Helianthus annuus]KAJ0846923.1 hypothetical protein HanRHA438_Chr15g0730381 [Helianthus annuus]